MVETFRSEVSDPVKRKKRRSGRVLAGLAALVVVYAAGYGVGTGRIQFGNGAIFRRSVQKSAPGSLDYSSVNQVYDNLKSDFDGQLDATKLLDGLKSGLASASGDPYTEYLNVKESQDFNDQLNGTFTGIGAELSKDAQNNIIVVAPIVGFPAEKAGLRPKDIIIEVDGKPLAGLGISDAVNKVRGPKGTPVKLKVVRNGSESLTLDIVREQITIPSVNSKILEGNIGYLQVSRFAEDTPGLAQNAANQFKEANVKGVILDMRSDPGGLLDASVKVSSLWLSNGKTVLLEKQNNVTVHTYLSSGSATLVGIPTVVLIDEGSASASEITAGALKDNGAATLIGTKSFGKGSVQQLEKLRSGGVLKVTIAHWFTPSGKTIDKTGIEPDQKVERTVDDIKARKDPQQDAALQFLKK